MAVTKRDLIVHRRALEEARDAMCKYCRRERKARGKPYCGAEPIHELIIKTQQELDGETEAT